MILLVGSSGALGWLQLTTGEYLTVTGSFEGVTIKVGG